MAEPAFPEDSWVQVRYPLTSEQEHADRAVLAADAAGFTAAAITQSFGLSRTSVTRVLFRDVERRS